MSFLENTLSHKNHQNHQPTIFQPLFELHHTLYAVSSDSDNKVIEVFLEKENKVDFVSNDMGCYSDDYELTFPLGLCNTKVFKSSLLEEAEKSTNDPVDREHVVNYIINNPDKYRLYNVEASGEYRRSDQYRGFTAIAGDYLGGFG